MALPPQWPGSAQRAPQPLCPPPHSSCDMQPSQCASSGQVAPAALSHHPPQATLGCIGGPLRCTGVVSGCLSTTTHTVPKASSAFCVSDNIDPSREKESLRLCVCVRTKRFAWKRQPLTKDVPSPHLYTQYSNIKVFVKCKYFYSLPSFSSLSSSILAPARQMPGDPSDSEPAGMVLGKGTSRSQRAASSCA